MRRRASDYLSYLSLVGIGMLLAPEDRWSGAYLAVSFSMMVIGCAAVVWSFIDKRRPR